MANRCPNCGKFLSAKDTKCSNCGAILSKDVKEEKVEPIPVEDELVMDEEEVDVSPAPDVIREGTAPIIITKYRNVEVRLPADLSRPSYFDGKTIQYIGWSLLGSLVTIFTLGILYPLAYGWLVKWECRHTVVCGYRMVFNGKAASLIGWWILWMFLTLITLGIFGLWVPVKLARWKVKRIKLVEEPNAPKKAKKAKKAKK